MATKNPGKVDFTQKTTPMTGNSTKKAPSKLGFKQPMPGAGKTSSAKNKGKLGFTQKTASNTGNSTKKNAGKVGFAQPNPAKKSTSMPGYSAKKVAPPAGKAKGQANVAPKIKSTDDIVAYRKKKYGV